MLDACALSQDQRPELTRFGSEDQRPELCPACCPLLQTMQAKCLPSRNAGHCCTQPATRAVSMQHSGRVVRAGAGKNGTSRTAGLTDPAIPLVNGAVQSGPDLSVTVNGLQLPNPFVIGSGPPGTNYQVMKKAFDEGWGAVICKTLSLDSSKVGRERAGACMHARHTGEGVPAPAQRLHPATKQT